MGRFGRTLCRLGALRAGERHAQAGEACPGG